MSYSLLLEKLGEEFKDCIDFNLSATENKRTFRLINKSNIEVCRVKVDQCLITNHNSKRCDYVFEICYPSNEKYFLVELKGTDVKHAIDQLLATLNYLRNKVDDNPKNYEGYIISSSVPRAAEQKFRQLKEQAIRNNGLKIIKKHLQSEIVI